MKVSGVRKKPVAFMACSCLHCILHTLLAAAPPPGPMDPHVGKATEKETEAITMLMNTALFVAQHKLPLSLINPLRSLQVLTGNEALSLVPGNGSVADPSSNYTGHQSHQDFIHSLATVSRQQLAAKWKASPCIGLSCDEVLGEDKESYLMASLQSLDSQGMVTSDFFGCVRMSLDKASLRIFAEDEVKSPVGHRYPLTLKCGLNMAFMLDAHATLNFPDSFRWENVTAGSMDGAGYVIACSH